MTLSSLALAAVVAASPTPDAPFPVPRAEAEFSALVPYLAGYCGNVAGNVTAFQQAALPYAPLDLQVRNASAVEARRLRTLWVAVAGAACSVEGAKLIGRFHCGPRCVASRRGDVVRKLVPLRNLAASFRKARNLKVVAQWGEDGEWRANDLFHMLGGQTNEARPSRAVALVPSSEWKQWNGVDPWALTAGVDADEVDRLVQTMRALTVAAVVRDGDAVRVVRIGVGASESGLLFLPKGAKPPAVGQALKDGRTYVAVEQVASDAVFYETR